MGRVFRRNPPFYGAFRQNDAATVALVAYALLKNKGLSDKRLKTENVKEMMNMKRTMRVACVALAMGTVIYAKGDVAKEMDMGWYASGKFAYHSVEQKLSSTFVGDYADLSDDEKVKQNFVGINVAGGYRFNPYVRGEAELGYASKSDFSWWTVMGQFYADLPIEGSPLKPYANIGLGLMQFTQSGFDAENGMCWNIGIGCSFAMTENLSIDASYRFFQTGAIKSTESYDGVGADYERKIKSNSLLAGVRYAF